MTTSGRGFRSGSRFKLRKGPRSKFTVEPFLKTFADGEHVAIDLYPASQKGMPHPRMQGLVGVVQSRRGEAYVIAVPVGRKTKTVIARPEHLHTIKVTARPVVVSEAAKGAVAAKGGRF